MKYDKRFSILSKEDALEILYQAAKSYNFDRLMNALIFKKHINFKVIEQLTYEINEAIPIMTQEYNKLCYFADGFVEAFFTDNNKQRNERQ